MGLEALFWVKELPEDGPFYEGTLGLNSGWVGFCQVERAGSPDRACRIKRLEDVSVGALLGEQTSFAPGLKHAVEWDVMGFETGKVGKGQEGLSLSGFFL